MDKRKKTKIPEWYDREDEFFAFDMKDHIIIDAIQDILKNGKTSKPFNPLMSYQELKAILQPKNKKMADLYFSEKEQIELRENLKSCNSDKDYERKSKKIFKLLFD